MTVDYEHFEADGNNGGSYVSLETIPDEPGYVNLEVGETCVRTIRQRISVVHLAAALTRARDIGFGDMMRDLEGFPEEWIEEHE